MTAVLLRAASLVAVIMLGIYLRRIGFMPAEAGGIMKKILIYITLPSAIVTNFIKIDFLDIRMIMLVFIGILANCLMIGVGILVTSGKKRSDKALFMNSLPAFNIGAFCLPFVQSFLPALGSVGVCLFDAGNSLMCTGGTYAFTAEYLSEEKKGIQVDAFVKRIVTSVPLMTYLTMTILSFLHIRLPQFVGEILATPAAANPFVAMLMLGLLFEFSLDRQFVGTILKLLCLRHVFGVALACFCYYVLPFDLVIRQALILISFGPMSAVAPVYTDLCGGDEGLASAANSASIIISVIEIVILLIIIFN